MAKEQTMKLSPLEAQDWLRMRASATAEARKILAAPIHEALNLQQKTIDDSVKLKVVGADGKGAEYRDKADGKTFWGALVTVAEIAKEHDLPASVVVAAVNEELGNPDAFDSRAATAKSYRASFPRVAGLYLSPNYQAACKLVGKDKDGQWIACDKDGNALPLHRLSYATARKAFTVFGKTDEEREFARQIQLFVGELKDASKNRAKNEKEGIVALAGVPLKTMIETVETLRGLIPARTVVKSAATDEMTEAAEGAEVVDTGDMVELGEEPQQQAANG